MIERYYFWKAPTEGPPEQSGHPVTIVQGLGQWVLLNILEGAPIPDGAIPALAVREILDIEA